MSWKGDLNKIRRSAEIQGWGVMGQLPGMLEAKGLPRMTEYRLWITIPGLAVDDEDHWEPFIVKLEQEYDLGAIIGWHAGKAEVVVSLPSESEAHATRVAVDAINRSARGDRPHEALSVERRGRARCRRRVDDGLVGVR